MGEPLQEVPLAGFLRGFSSCVLAGFLRVFFDETLTVTQVEFGLFCFYSEQREGSSASSTSASFFSSACAG